MTFAVYRWFDDAGALLYVGMSQNVAQRVFQHASVKATWHDKIASCKVTHFDSRGEAENAEQDAIKNELPLFNVVHHPNRKAKTQRGLSLAARKAKEYLAKHPDELTGEQLAKKFGLNPATVYRADWWKGRNKPVEKQVQQ